MNLLICILMIIPISILLIMLWIYNDYRKYKKLNKLVILLFLLFPINSSAQYIDNGCKISFKWFENEKGKLEYSKDGVTYKFIPSDDLWEITIYNNSSEDIQINWDNVQAIINGRTSIIRYILPEGTEEPPTTIKSQAEISQKIGMTTYIGNKEYRKIYNKKEIKKGKNGSLTIIFPASIGQQPQFSYPFDFTIKQAD